MFFFFICTCGFKARGAKKKRKVENKAGSWPCLNLDSTIGAKGEAKSLLFHSPVQTETQSATSSGNYE